MSLIPNKKNKKDNRPGGGHPSAKSGIQNTGAAKVKSSTRAMNKSARLTGGSQRGS